MVLHGVYDAAQLGLFAITLRIKGIERVMEQAAQPLSARMDAGFWLQMLIGTLLLAAGAWLLRAEWRRRDAGAPAIPIHPVSHGA